MTFSLLSLLGLKRSQPAAELMTSDAKRELESHIEAALQAHCGAAGQSSLFAQGLRIIVSVDGVRISHESASNSLAEVGLRDLNVMQSFLVIRDEHLAIPQDVLQDIAGEAARALVRQIRALEISATP